MVALFHRDRTGEGQELDSSLLGGQLCIQTHNFTDFLWGGTGLVQRPRVGFNPTWSVYKGSDGKWTAEHLNVANMEGPLPYVLAFAQDGAGEVYALTSMVTGPVGKLDKIYKIVPAQ